MDWNLKATSWGLSEFMGEAIPNIDAVNGSSSYGGPEKKGDFSVDLKLGQLSNSGEESISIWKGTGDAKMEPSTSGSAKRARATNGGAQVVSCLVDGCTADLSNCREYHRRHKVCEIHSKTPEVLIGGQKQRFCQQCSRFHSLEEFDEGKRSCRKRLDGHNRRRRKPQPDPLARPTTYLSNYQGAHLLPLSSSHVYPSTTVVRSSWAGVISSETDARLLNQQQPLSSPEKQDLFLGFSPRSYREEKQFMFMQSQSNALHSQTSPEASVCQPLLKTMHFSEGIGGVSCVFCDGLATPIQDSDCALSLLSSPQTQTSAICLNHAVQPNFVSIVQSLGPSMQERTVDPMDSVVVANKRNVTFRCPEMLPICSDVSSGDEAPQTLPFRWE